MRKDLGDSLLGKLGGIAEQPGGLPRGGRGLGTTCQVGQQEGTRESSHRWTRNLKDSETSKRQPHQTLWLRGSTWKAEPCPRL